MSANVPCRCPDKAAAKREHWYVWRRLANCSAFNGYRETPSDYSAIACNACSASWRTKAAYVAQLPDRELT
jgi:hypothetical protein